MRKVIKESKSVVIEKVNGANDYPYWVYEITPMKVENKDGVKIVTGGCKIWNSMHKTLEEALIKFDILNNGN